MMTCASVLIARLAIVVIATDCGSTTTKAILIEKRDGVFRQTFRGEAPTTVEAPHEDVTRGVLNAIREVEELAGRRILDGERIRAILSFLKRQYDYVVVDVEERLADLTLSTLDHADRVLEPIEA